MKTTIKGSYKLQKNGKIVVTPNEKPKEVPTKYLKNVHITFEDGGSVGENNLMHGCFRKIAEHTGHTFNDIKVYMKHKFLGYTETTVDGTVIKELKHTSNLTMSEKAKFIDDISQWAWHEFQIQIIENESEGPYMGAVVSGYRTQ